YLEALPWQLYLNNMYWSRVFYRTRRCTGLMPPARRAEGGALAQALSGQGNGGLGKGPSAPGTDGAPETPAQATSAVYALGAIVPSPAPDVFVQVQSVGPSGFQFASLPGHPLYPATISFSARDSAPGQVTFNISVRS